MRTMHKRIVEGKVVQIFLETSEKDFINLIPYSCEAQYYGEGIKRGELIEIDIEEFRELGRIYNCFVKEREAAIGGKS